MLYFADLRKYVHVVQCAAQQASLEAQAEAVNRLFLFLYDHQEDVYPSALSTQANEIFRWYLTNILPQQDYEEDDRCWIAEEYVVLLERRQVATDSAQCVEDALVAILNRLKQGTYDRARSAAADILRLVYPFPDQTTHLHGIQSRQLQKSFLRKTFNAGHVAQFFKQCFEILPEPPVLRSLCEYALDAYFQAKAVLVDTFLRGCLTPCRVSVDLGKRSEHVEFLMNQIDHDMQGSADIARVVACQYVRENFEQDIPDQIAVCCQFANPALNYRDTSASLLIGLRVVGKLLGLDADPAIAVTGEIAPCGNVSGVGYISQKMQALREHSVIEQVIMPASNLSDLPTTSQQSFNVISVQTFDEAVQRYYGQRLQQHVRQIRPARRQLLLGIGIGSVGLLAAPVALWGRKNPVVTTQSIEQATWNIEYATLLYEQHNQHEKARTVLQFVLNTFKGQTSVDARRIQAQALEESGWSHAAQHQKPAAMPCLLRSLDYWKSLHDQEKQVHLLILLGAVLGDGGVVEEIQRSSARALEYFHAAHNLLTSAMQGFHALQGRYCSRLGILYYWLGEESLAAECTAKALEHCADTDLTTGRYYQLVRQHLGRVLIRRKAYEQAYDLIQSSSQSPLLQSPADRARSFRTLSDFYFSAGDRPTGITFAHKTMELSQAFDLKIQRIGIQEIFTRYHVPLGLIREL